MIGIGDWAADKWLQFLVNTDWVNGTLFNWNKAPGAELKGQLNTNAGTDLYGKWQWLQSSGRLRRGICPTSTGYVCALDLDNEGSFTVWKNDAIVSEGAYDFVIKRNNLPNEYIIFNHTHTGRQKQVHFRFIGKNILCLTEDTLLRRNRHLFVRNSCF